MTKRITVRTIRGPKGRSLDLDLPDWTALFDFFPAPNRYPDHAATDRLPRRTCIGSTRKQSGSLKR